MNANRRTPPCPSDYQSGDENHPNSPYFREPREEELDGETLAENLTDPQAGAVELLADHPGRRDLEGWLVEELVDDLGLATISIDQHVELTDKGECAAEYLESIR